MNWIKNLTPKISLIVFGLVVGLLIAEGILRILGRKPLGENYIYPRWYYTATDYGYDINRNFWPPAVAHVESFEYPVWSNDIGCFDNPPSANPKILIVGDSFTWGYTPFEEKWGTILERELRAGTLKCGVSGFGTKQSLIKAANLLRSFPSVKVVIYSYCLNDLDDDYLYPHFTVIGGHRLNKVVIKDFNDGSKTVFQPTLLKRRLENFQKYGTIRKPPLALIHRVKFWLNKHSALYYSTKGFLKAVLSFLGKEFLENVGLLIPSKGFDVSYPLLIFGLDKHPWIKDVLRDHLRNVKAFKKLNRKLVVPLIPLKEQVYPELMYSERYKAVSFIGNRMITFAKNDEELLRPQRILRKFLEQEGIAYIDYLPLLRFYADYRKKDFLNPERDLYWTFDGHWSVKGNRLIGLLLTRFLVKENIIELHNKKEILARIDNFLKSNFGKVPPEDVWKNSIYVPVQSKTK